MNIVRITYRFAKTNAPQMFKPIEIGRKPKQSKEFKQAKQYFKSIIVGENNIKESILENYSPNQIYKQIDTNLDVFFAKRPYDLHSFNFLIHLLAVQDKFDQLPDVLLIMDKMNLPKDLQTYQMLMHFYTKIRDIQKVEYYFELASKKYGNSLQLFNTLINAYAKNYLPERAQKAFQDCCSLGFHPDVQLYTTLINAYYRKKEYQKCWDLFDQVRLGKSSNTPDENLLGLMIEISADTHDAEKAINIYANMNEMEFKESTLVFNSMIKALGSRPDYSEKALEYFKLMQMKQIPMDSDTIVSALKACASSGDVKTAHDVIKIMQEKGIQENKYIYNQIIKVYAGACRLEFLDLNLRNQYVEDAWKILNEAAQKKFITQWTLNSMCDLMVSADKLADLEGLVLPLFEQYQIEKNAYTYEAIIRLLNNEKRILDVYRIFDSTAEKMQPTFKSVCCYIETAILAADEDRVLSALEWFNKLGRMPKFKYLSQLSNVQNLPVRIHAMLDEYSTKFGPVKNKHYRSQKSDNYKQQL